MQFMVVETFLRGPELVYRRFAERGRMAPEGLIYISSWVDTSLQRCFQLMETQDVTLIDQWVAHWSDIVRFEIIPIISSSQAAELVAQINNTRGTTQ